MATRLYVGRVGRAVGLKGEVDIAVTSDAPDRFDAGSVLFTPDDRTLVVRTMRKQGERTIVAFEGVDDRTAAEALKGAELSIDESQARSLEEGEYWDHDLIGCEVVTTDGTSIGEVTDVLHGANEVLVVRGDAKEHLIPLISEVVKHVEPRVRIAIEPVPGLLD